MDSSVNSNSLRWGQTRYLFSMGQRRIEAGRSPWFTRTDVRSGASEGQSIAVVGRKHGWFS
jgi:hypothetical protein